MSIAEIIALIAGFAGLITAIATALKYRTEASIAKEAAKVAKKQLDQAVKRGEFDIMSDTIDKIDKRNQTLEGRIQAERDARNLIECEFEKYKDDSEKRIEALEDALLAKDKEIAALQEQARVLEDAVKRLEEQLEKLGETPITKKKGTGPLRA